MTNENAIKQLKRMKMDKSHTGDEYNAIMTAIKALEQEPCDKCEVGNPCLYCKYAFEPQESEEIDADSN